jgi:hypothetical protein
MIIGFTIVPEIIDDILSAEEWVYWGGATYSIFDIVSENLAVLAAINCPRSSRKIGSCWRLHSQKKAAVQRI